MKRSFKKKKAVKTKPAIIIQPANWGLGHAGYRANGRTGQFSNTKWQ